MKNLFAALTVLMLAGTSAHADWGHGPVPPPPPPPGFDHNGPGWDHGDRGPGWDHGDRGPGWDHGPRGPGWDHGPRGPGWGPGPGFPPPPPPPPPVFTQFIECDSAGYNVSYCPVPGFIVNAQVTNQRSFAACELGQSYGYQGNNVWVKDGCRATFAVTIRR
ncbi:MAG: DUF3011 domain-containing protein [Bdellovibrionota bacterium]